MGSQKLTDLSSTSTPAQSDLLYLADVSDTTDDAAGSSKKITVETLTHGQLDVTWYGAVGDGSTNNDTAFSDAIAALPSEGGTIFVPEGHYIISSKITINKPCIFYGEGKGSYIEQDTNNRDGIHIDSSDVEVHSIRVSGAKGTNEVGGDGSCIHAYNSSFGDGHRNIRIHDCWFDDCWNGVRMGKDSFDTDEDGTEDTLVVVTDWWVYNNTFSGTLFKAIEVWGDNGFIYGNHIEMGSSTGVGNETGRCIRFVGAKNVIAHHNYMKAHPTTKWPLNVGVNGSPGPVYRYPENIDINNNVIETEGTQVLQNSHCNGYLRFCDNICTDSAATASTFPALSGIGDGTDGGVQRKIDRFIVNGNRLYSYQGLIRLGDGLYDYVQINNNWIVTTSDTTNGPGLFRDDGQTNPLKYCEFHNNTVITDGTGSGGTVRLLNTDASEHYSIKFNSMTKKGSLVASSGSATIDDSLNDGSSNSFSTNTELPASLWADPTA